MSKKFEEYPKWIKTFDNREIIVHNEEEEIHQKGLKNAKEDNSTKLSEIVTKNDSSSRTGRKPI